MKSEIDFLNEIITRWNGDIKDYEHIRDDYKAELSRIDGIIATRKLSRDVLLDRLNEMKGGEDNV